MARETALEQTVNKTAFIRGHPAHTEIKQSKSSDPFKEGQTYYMVGRWQPACRVCDWTGVSTVSDAGAKQLAQHHSKEHDDT